MQITSNGTRVEQQKIRVHIREVIRRDMPEVLAIEADSFEFPWLEEDFIRCLRQRNCNGVVAKHKDRVVGFMVYEFYKTQYQVLNLTTAADCLRKGVGSQMVDRLIAKLTPQRRSRIALEVRETNLPAQLFWREQGFRATAVWRGFYADHTPEDAYVFEYRVK